MPPLTMRPIDIEQVLGGGILWSVDRCLCLCGWAKDFQHTIWSHLCRPTHEF